MAEERRATVMWEGDLKGSGRVVEVGSGALGELPVTWASRTEASDGKTSPEELIASAHAACFSMSLANILAQAGNPPERLDVTATSTFAKRDEGWRITKMELEVLGSVPGMEAGDFAQHAEAAKEACPVSNALKGNVEMSVKASFA